MANDNVIKGNFRTTGDIDAQKALEAIAEDKMAEGKHMALIIYDDNTCFYFSSEGDFTKVMYQLEQWKHKFFSGDFDED